MQFSVQGDAAPAAAAAAPETKEGEKQSFNTDNSDDSYPSTADARAQLNDEMEN